VVAHDQLTAALRAQGITTKIANYGGLRSLADTTTILQYRANDYAHDLAAGIVSSSTPIEVYRPIAPFGSSYHNYGAAFDLAIVSAPPGISSYHALQIAGNLAPSYGLRWGGGPEFTAANRTDSPHFELAIPLSEARRRYEFNAGASSSSSLPDISALLGLGPELTPSSDIPDYGDTAYSEGDETALELLPPASSPMDLFLIAGAALAVALTWAIRRRYFAG
jgi:hypothetical protein